MKRQNFLHCFAGLCLPKRGSQAATRLPGSKRQRRILVIGAGLAGLSAARFLHDQGQAVLILEARERLGGRIWTSQRWPELPLDLGATWIHRQRGNPLTALADKLAAPRWLTHYDRAEIYNPSGQVLTDGEARQLARVRQQMYRYLRRAQQQEADQSVAEAVATLAASWSSASTARHFLDFLLSSEIEHEYAGSIRQLSAHWYDSSKDFSGDDALFQQGFQVIPQYLAQGLSIHFAQVAKVIHWDGAGVVVETQNHHWRGDQVLLTVPLGVLQAGTLRFVPDLPSDKQMAIAKLGMGVLNKCYLRFAKAFWPPEYDWLEYIAPQFGQWTEWVSFLRLTQQPILLGFTAGDYGRSLEAKSAVAIVDEALQTLKTLFGTRLPQLLDYQLTRWASDPYAQGAYSYYAVGSQPALRDTLAAPLQRQLFFAGEATTRDYFATAHGAYLSGLRAAKEMLAG